MTQSKGKKKARSVRNMAGSSVAWPMQEISNVALLSVS